MGHWDETPYANDGAMDLLPDFHEAVFKAVRKAWDLSNYDNFPFDEVRCTAQYIIDYCAKFSNHSHNYYPSILRIKEALMLIAKSNYDECWRDPALFKKNLCKQLKNIKIIEKDAKHVHDLFYTGSGKTPSPCGRG